MRNLTIDDETYAAWQQRAAAQGLSIEEWLKRKTGHDNGNGQFDVRPSEQLTIQERLQALDQFEAGLEGQRGNSALVREQLYD